MGIRDIINLKESLSGSAPSAADEGVSLEGVKNYRVILSADSGATLSGAGTYKFYHYNLGTGWAEDPRLAGSVSSSGVRSIILDEREIGPDIGRMRVVFTGLTVSAGAANVRYELGN